MKFMKILTVLSVALMFSVVTPQGADAQGLCGEDCCWCGGSPDHIGGCPAHGGDYNAFCHYNWWFCEGCPQTLLNDQAIEAEGLAKLLKATEVSDLAPFVSAYSDRLLLVSERNEVVVRGNPCDPSALELVVEVTPQKTQALLRMKVRTLEEFLIKEPAPRR